MADRDLEREGARNSLEGKGDQLKGKVKDAAGGLTGDSGMQAEGKWDKAKGRAKDALGDVQRNIGGDSDSQRDR